MKKISLFLLFILWPFIASAAINANTNWELRGNGNDTNGGGFAIGVSSKSSKTDLAVDASNNLQVTSAGYGFTSADVNRWIQVTAGTGWTVGYYQITAVSSGKATLSHSPAATSTTAGSFNIYWGLDYSQQNAKNANGGSNGSSVLAAATGSTTITCSDCSFTNDIVGSVVYFSGGTGSIAAVRRSVTGFTNSTTIVIDTLIASSTGMTLNIGGALATMDEALGSRGVVSTNVLWWKNDTPIASTSTLFSVTIALRINGYSSTRGDLDGSIGSSNRPTLTFTGSSGYAMTFSTNAAQLRDFIVNASSGSGANGISVTGTLDDIYNVTVKNYDGIGYNLAGTAGLCYACEATGGTVNATKGISVGNGMTVYDSYVHDGNGVGISGTSTPIIEGNIVSNMAGAAADCIQLTSVVNATSIVLNNIGFNCGRDGFSITTSNGTPPLILGNIFSSNGRYGFNLPANTNAIPLNDGNAYYNNTTAARNNADLWNQTNSNPAYLRANDVILSGNPFVSTGTGNFALNATAGAGGALRNAGLPRAWPGSITAGYADVGPVFHQDPGTVTVNANCAF